MKLRNVKELAIAAGGAKGKFTSGFWKTTAVFSLFILIQALCKMLPD